MNELELRASIPWELPRLFDLPIANISVVSDSVAGRRSERLDRIISGEVLRFHSDWQTFVSMWTLPFLGNLNTPYGEFWRVPNLQVNHDHYGFISGIRLNGNQITILASENFLGSDEDYRREVQRRSFLIGQRISKWNSKQVTALDYMELTGNNWPGNSSMPIPDEIVNSIVATLNGREGFSWRTNTIV